MTTPERDIHEPGPPTLDELRAEFWPGLVMAIIALGAIIALLVWGA